MNRRWNRNVVSLLSSVTAEMRLPISCVNSMAVSCHVPAVSIIIIIIIIIAQRSGDGSLSVGSRGKAEAVCRRRL